MQQTQEIDDAPHHHPPAPNTTDSYAFLVGRSSDDNNNNNNNNNNNARRGEGGEAIAYAAAAGGGGGDGGGGPGTMPMHPAILNGVRRATSGTRSLVAHHFRRRAVVGGDGGGGGAIDDDDDGDDDDDDYDDEYRDKRIVFYCLPCISFGAGARGKRRVRILTLIFFPLFLLGLFLLDDVGRAVERGVRVHLQQQHQHATTAGSSATSPSSGATSHSDREGRPVPRYKWMNQFPGITREVLWIPVEARATATASVGDQTSYEAAMLCPRGVLFLFHGCGRYAASFFYSPQGRKIVEAAYDAGLLVATFKKTDEMGCWDWRDEGETVLKMGRKFLTSKIKGLCGKDENGESAYPPVWGFGASSGGYFAASLAARMREDPESYRPFLFSALNVQIMSTPLDLVWDIPTVFTIMEGDPVTKANVERLVSHKAAEKEEGDGGGVGGGGGPFKVVSTSGQKGIHPWHFDDLYADDERMTLELSSSIYKDLVDANIIDDTKRDVPTADPRNMVEAITSVWKKYVMAHRTSDKDEKLEPPFGMSRLMMRPLKGEELLDADGLWLIEELNVAWDVHEITAEGFDGVLEFFDEFGGGRPRQ